MTAVALRALPVPDCEPPVDLLPAAHHRGPRTRPRVRAVQGVLSLVVDRPDDVHPRADHHHDDLDVDDREFGPRRTASSDLPPVQEWGRRLVQVVVEVMCAQRPASQLLRHTSQPVYDQVISQTLPPARRSAGAQRRRPRVTSVRVCEPADGVAELSAVVHGQYRVQAMALRLEGRDGRWRVTALECG